MKFLYLFTVSALALGLAACGGAEDSPPDDTAQTETPMDTAAEMTNEGAMDHSDHDMGAASERIGHGAGVIRSVGSQGDFLVINHGPLEGINMGAMTMGFDIMGDVDLSGFAEGDQVAFMVKQGRDNSYRIMNICNTGTDGADCLENMMDH